MTKPVISEKAITKAVIDHWRAFGVPGTLVAAIPNMGAMGQYGLTKGLPDLLVIGPMGAGFLELKIETGKRTGAQVEFADLCWKHGVNYWCCYGRDDPIAKLKEWGVIKA